MIDPSFEDYVTQTFAWEYTTKLTRYDNDVYYWQINYKQEPYIELGFARSYHEEEVTCLWLTESIFKTIFDYMLGICAEFICGGAKDEIIKLTIYQSIHRLNVYSTSGLKIITAAGEYDAFYPETSVSLQDAFSISYATESRLKNAAKGLLKLNGIYCPPNHPTVNIKPLSRY